MNQSRENLKKELNQDMDQNQSNLKDELKQCMKAEQEALKVYWRIQRLQQLGYAGDEVDQPAGVM